MLPDMSLPVDLVAENIHVLLQVKQLSVGVDFLKLSAWCVDNC